MSSQFDLLEEIKAKNMEKLKSLPINLEYIQMLPNMRLLKAHMHSLPEEERYDMIREVNYLISFVDETPLELRMEMVEKDGLALEFIEDQTPEMTQAAVDQNPHCLKFVITQNKDMCLGAVERDKSVIPMVREHVLESVLHGKYFPRNGFDAPKGRIFIWKDEPIYTISKKVISEEAFLEWFSIEKNRMKPFHQNGYREFLGDKADQY